MYLLDTMDSFRRGDESSGTGHSLMHYALTELVLYPVKEAYSLYIDGYVEKLVDTSVFFHNY